MFIPKQAVAEIQNHKNDLLN